MSYCARRGSSPVARSRGMSALAPLCALCAKPCCQEEEDLVVITCQGTGCLDGKAGGSKYHRECVQGYLTKLHHLGHKDKQGSKCQHIERCDLESTCADKEGLCALARADLRACAPARPPATGWQCLYQRYAPEDPRRCNGRIMESNLAIKPKAHKKIKPKPPNQPALPAMVGRKARELLVCARAAREQVLLYSHVLGLCLTRHLCARFRAR